MKRCRPIVSGMASWAGKNKRTHPAVEMMSKAKLSGRKTPTFLSAFPHSPKVTLGDLDTFQQRRTIWHKSITAEKWLILIFFFAGQKGGERSSFSTLSLRKLTSVQSQSLNQVVFEWKIKPEDSLQCKTNDQWGERITKFSLLIKYLLGL